MKGSAMCIAGAMIALTALCACERSDDSSNFAATPLVAHDHATTAKLGEVRKPNTTPSQWAIPQHSPHSDVALVFVHGIFGDTLGTWENPTNGKHFYDLVASDPRFGPKVDIFAFGFPSMMLKQGSFTIQEAANKLLSDLQYYGVLTYPHIVFVAHSMGGLVTLRALITEQALLPKVPLLVFFSTPQEGAQITLIARELLSNPALGEMSPADNNSELQELNDQWRSIPKTQQSHIACAFEKLPIAGITIVPWSSASRFCDGPAAAVEADHIEIVKPLDTNSDSYITLANALTGYALAGVNAANAAQGVLETPDFTFPNGHAVLTINDPHGRRDVHISNGGPGRLRYMLDQFPATGLYVLPDIGPHYVDRDKVDTFSLVVGYEAISPTYHFVISSSGGPPLPVTVHVENLVRIRAFQARVVEQFSDKLNPINAGNRNQHAIGEAAIAEAAESVIAKNYGNSSAAAKSPLVAQLVNLVQRQLVQQADWQATFNVLSETADNICATTPVEGSGNSLGLTEYADAKLSGAVGQLASLNVAGAAKYQSPRYKRSLREDLAAVLENNSTCRLTVFNTLMNKVVLSPEHYNWASQVNMKTGRPVNAHTVPGPAPNRSTGSNDSPTGEPLYSYSVITEDGKKCNNGRIEKKPAGGWVELIPAGADCHKQPIGYAELGQDNGWFYIFDAGRNMTARIPRATGNVYWVIGKVYPYGASSTQWYASQPVMRIH